MKGVKLLLVLAVVLLLTVGCDLLSDSVEEEDRGPTEAAILDLCYVAGVPQFVGTTGIGSLANGTRVLYVNTSGQIIEHGEGYHTVWAELDPAPVCDQLAPTS